MEEENLEKNIFSNKDKIEVEERKTTPKTYVELRELAYKQIENNKSIENYLEAIECFDVDPFINNQLLQAELNCGYEQFSLDLEKYINTLTLEQRKNLIEQIEQKKIEINNIPLSKKSNKELYLSMIKFLKKNDMKIFDKKFKSICTCKIDHFKIPLIYGSEELRYAWLLNHLYYNIIILKDEPPEENVLVKGQQYNEIQKVILNKDNNNNNIKQNNKINTEIDDKNTIYSKDNINNVIINSKKDEEVNMKAVYLKKRTYLNDLITKIISIDFGELFDEDNSSINLLQENSLLTKDKLFMHLLFFDISLTIVSSYNINNDTNDCLKSMINTFFETNKEKNNIIKQYKRLIELYEIKNYITEKINIRKNSNIIFKNKDYIIKFINDKNKEEIYFNPYDYSFYNLFNLGKINAQEFKIRLNDVNCFSMKKVFDNNKLFQNLKIFNEYKKNINDMLTSDVLNECFKQMNSCTQFNNPYNSPKKKEFIEQLNKIIFYFKMPHNNILGYNYKTLGLIFINTNFPKRLRVKEETKIIKKIIDVAIKKITELHEIFFHHILTILHSNSENISIETPDNTFINYYPKNEFESIFKKYDGGDRGESLLFGNKINCIYFQAALFLLKKDNWENDDLDKFRELFLKENIFKNSIYSFQQENNILIKMIIKSMNRSNSYTIKLSEKNSKVNFKIQDFNDSDTEEDDQCVLFNRISIPSFFKFK